MNNENESLTKLHRFLIKQFGSVQFYSMIQAYTDLKNKKYFKYLPSDLNVILQENIFRGYLSAPEYPVDVAERVYRLIVPLPDAVISKNYGFFSLTLLKHYKNTLNSPKWMSRLPLHISVHKTNRKIFTRGMCLSI